MTKKKAVRRLSGEKTQYLTEYLLSFQTDVDAVMKIASGKENLR